MDPARMKKPAGTDFKQTVHGTVNTQVGDGRVMIVAEPAPVATPAPAPVPEVQAAPTPAPLAPITGELDPVTADLLSEIPDRPAPRPRAAAKPAPVPEVEAAPAPRPRVGLLMAGAGVLVAGLAFVVNNRRGGGRAAPALTPAPTAPAPTPAPAPRPGGLVIG